MSKNSIMTRDGNVVLPFSIASVTAGDVVAIGSAGLTGYALTDTYDESAYTTETIAVPPQGLADGEVSLEVIGVSRVVKLTVAGGVAVGAAIYSDGSGGYDGTSTTEVLVGYALEAISAGEEGLVGLARA